MKPMFTVEVYRDRKKQHRGRVRHRNGKIILATSEGDGYRRRADCVRAIANAVRYLGMFNPLPVVDVDK